MDEGHPINTEVYQRVNALFVSKRNSLPPERIGHLATEVITRLAMMAPASIQIDCAEIDSVTVSEFCDLLIKAEPIASLSFIQDLKARGASSQLIRYGLIARAARCLGERWDRSETSLMDVTIATGQLYALIRATRSEGIGVGLARRTRPHALFASVPGETHTLGITLAPETFHEAGWDIDLQTAETHDDLISHIAATQPTVVGLSLSTKERLPDLIRLVLALRILLPTAIIGVAPALDMDDDEILGLVDIDLIFRDARIALNDLERLTRLRR